MSLDKQRLLVDLKEWEVAYAEKGWSNHQSTIAGVIYRIESGRYNVPIYPTVDAYEAVCKALWKHRGSISEAIAEWESMDEFDDTVLVIEKVIKHLKDGLASPVPIEDYKTSYEALVQALRDGYNDPLTSHQDDLIYWIEATCPFLEDQFSVKEETDQ
ncbi:hypothetical protein [Paenibacillus sp. L3-i20]|uniref:hypothetical protein n=1 Tax=Paenibacillus sp. L3-i20 TaxID=2905833 RepID=UPI001EDEA39E|nr:hypothetical protein [Paenibacillus sp. L3-i20]GKU76879.1 hypothetical protein L3i20_v212760 [Paenibacillus sp. L3-i20]